MLEVRDPADVRSVVGEVPEMTAGQVAAAYVRSTIVVRENGKTLAEARVEVTKKADFRDYASFARQPWGELLSDARPGTQTGIRVQTPLIASWVAGLLAEPDAVTFTGGKNVSVVLADPAAAAPTEKLTGRVAEIVVGPGLDPSTTVGPLSYAAHHDDVLELIERARKAVRLAGGFHDSGSPFKEQGAPGLRFYTRIKTAAVRYQW